MQKKKEKNSVILAFESGCDGCSYVFGRLIKSKVLNTESKARCKFISQFTLHMLIIA